MPHSTLMPRGRPKSANPLTPAQKQAAYRQRVNQRLVADRVGHDFIVKFVNAVDSSILELNEKYNRSFYMDEKARFYARISELKLLKIKLLGHGFVLDSNQQKIYKQDDLYD